MNLLTLALLLGAVFPPVIAVVQHEHWPSAARAGVALALVAVAAFATCWGKGEWTGLNQASVDAYGSALSGMIATTWGSYHALWTKLGVTQWIERATSWAQANASTLETILATVNGLSPAEKTAIRDALTPPAPPAAAPPASPSS